MKMICLECSKKFTTRTFDDVECPRCHGVYVDIAADQTPIGAVIRHSIEAEQDGAFGRDGSKPQAPRRYEA